MNKLIEIIQGLNGSLSSKRVAGLYCVIVAATTIAVLSFILPEFPAIDDLLDSVLFTGAGLLGLGLFDIRRGSSSKTLSSSEDKETNTKTDNTTQTK